MIQTSASAHVLLVLHMHQPYYLDPLTDEYRLPWVRLHAVREYYDVVSLALAHPEVQLTINMVPSLLLQLDDNARNPHKDYFYRLSLLDPDSLTESQRRFLITNFFLANWNRMILPIPRYRELLDLRGRDIKTVDWPLTLRRFGVHEIMDLQVLFNLAWIGFTAAEEHPEVGQLMAKGRLFSVEDKLTVLRLHERIMNAVLPRYRQAAASGRIELSTSPAYHPILPLLMDSSFARRCDPSTPLPTDSFRHPEDAQEHLVRARELFERFIGVAPRGLWPSEGSVCPELIPMTAREGFAWIATDEEVLRTTLNTRPREEIIFRPWRVRHDGSETAMIFRDKGLSDLIGFTYSRNPAEAAVDHFMGHLHTIASRDPLAQIAVVLDGENPWEHYEQGGRPFMKTLFDRLSSSPLVQSRTVSASLREHPAVQSIERLHTASWINNNFRVWIGGEEENIAWSYLARVRRDLQDAAPSLTPEKRRRAFEAIYAAEGSDWFWWYGDTFTSDTPELFDTLFRTHLAAVYREIGRPTPDFLAISVLKDVPAGPLLQVVDYIHPTLDGAVTSYYEWWGAGSIDLTGAGGGAAGGAMASGTRLLSKLFVGFDRDNLYLRIDPDQSAPDLWDRLNSGELHLQVQFVQPQRYVRWELCGQPDGAKKITWVTGTPAGDSSDIVFSGNSEAAVGRVMEARLPRNLLALPPGSAINMAVRLVKNGDLRPGAPHFELIRYPRHGYFTLLVPPEDFLCRTWSAL